MSDKHHTCRCVGSEMVLTCFLVWFWWQGGCTMVKDVIKEHGNGRSRGQEARQAEPERDAGK